MDRLGYYLGWILTLAMVTLAFVSTILRVFLLTLDDSYPWLSRWASDTYDMKMEIGEAIGEWKGMSPSIILEDVTLDLGSMGTVHHFDNVAFSLDLIKSLVSLSPVPKHLVVTGGSIQLHRLENGQWELEEMPIDQMEPSMTPPIDRLLLREMTIVLHDKKTGGHLYLEGLNIDVVAGLLGSDVVARGQTETSEGIDFELHLEFDATASGSGVLRIERAKLDQLLPWFPDSAKHLAKRLPANAGMRLEAQLAWENQVPRLAGTWIELEPSHPNGANWKQMAATVAWRTEEEGYTVSLENLELDRRVVADGVHIEHNARHTQGYLHSLDLGRAKRIAEIVGFRMEDFLPGSITSGLLSRVRGEIDWQDTLSYHFQADISDIDISIPSNDFLLSGLDGSINGSEQGIRFVLHSEDLAVSYAPWHIEEFRPGLTKFRLDWWPGEDCCAFRLADIRVETPALLLHGEALMSADVPRRFQVDVSVEHADLASVSKWIPPGLLQEKDERWIRGAFKKGHLSEARFRLDGPFSSGMLAMVDSELMLDGVLQEVSLNYDSALPMLENLSGWVFLDKKSLHVLVREANIEKSTLVHGALRIADLNSIDIYSSGVIHGPVAAIPDFLEQVEWMNPAFNQIIKFGGDSRLDLALNIPLDQLLRKDTEVQGILIFQDNQMDILPNDTRLSGIKGQIRYEKESLVGSLDAQFMQRPARIGLGADPSGNLRIKMQAFALPQDYMPQTARSTLSWVTGHSAWNLTFLLPGVTGKSKRNHLTVFANSDLHGVEIDLPKPLGKAAGLRHPLELEADIKFDGEIDALITYTDQARARFRISSAGATQGTVFLGTEMPTLTTDAQLKVTGKTKETNLQDWIAWRNRHAGGKGLWPEISDLQIDRLKLYGFDVPNAKVSARFDQGSDHFEINAPIIRGMVNIPNEKRERTVGVFDRLHLSTEQMEALSDTKSPDFNPAEIPPLDLKFRSFYLGPYRLNDVILVTSPDNGQATIEKLQAQSRDFSMNLSGHWEFTKGEHSTLLSGLAHTDDLHETLNHWSIGNSLRQGVMDAKMDLQWAGAPYDYEVKRLQGHVTIEGRDGRIRNVAPELGRVLALLNLEMIFKRLSLDFDDVIRGGFTYQTAEGKFDFRGGSLHTSEFRIIGPSAQFLIAGRIGVQEEDYDLKIIATPETSVLLPAIGVVGGPLGIAGAYLGSKVLEWLGLGIDQATTVAYEVTGSWLEPVIKEVKKE